jgi:hypothetical protein
MEEQLLAWLTPHHGQVEGAFVAVGTEREPARRLCGSEREARCWIEREAASFGAAITWVAAG